MESWNCAYLLALEEQCQLIDIPCFRQLFSEREISLISLCQRLSFNDKCLLSRMILRKHDWMRSTSLVNYLPSKDHSQVIETLQNMENLGVSLSLAAGLSWDDVWEAACSCLTKDEWKSISQLLKLQLKASELRCLFLPQSASSVDNCAEFIYWGTKFRSVCCLSDVCLVTPPLCSSLLSISPLQSRLARWEKVEKVVDPDMFCWLGWTELWSHCWDDCCVCWWWHSSSNPLNTNNWN